MILVYTRYIPGIYQVWKYMGIYLVYTSYIADMVICTVDSEGIYQVYTR